MDKYGQIHFVGSIAGDSAEDVFSMCGESVGNLVATMPDGETGNRSQYVRFLADTIYSKHPDIVAVQQPMTIDTDTQAGEEGMPVGEDSPNMRQFRLREGVTELEFDVLGYGDAAVESYQVYAKLRSQGVIPKDVRFQVSLPNAIDGSMPMLADLNDLPIFVSAYEKAMAKDIRIITENIPASDLAFQWDNVCSVLEHEMAPTTPDQSPAQSHSPTERFRELFSRFQQNIPDEIPLGIHFCYGDAGHKHMMQPPDLGVSVKLANEALDVATRPIDWIHMPVPMSRNDEDYFRPLRGLNDNTRLFLGLVHHTDGVEGTVKRIQSAKKFKKDFGIATECGFGRRPADQIPELLEIHRKSLNAI